ncbi:MAG: efflux RND transporter permease subunit [Planctomycetota bacterium]
MLPFIWMGSKRALKSNRNDVKDWLPANFPETADHRWFQKHFPYEQFVLCSWEGCTLDDERVELLARKLVPEETPEPEEESAPPTSLAQVEESKPKEPWYFKSVLTGPRIVQELLDRYESLSEEDVLERLKGSLIGKDYHTCLVVTLTDEAKGKNLRVALAKIRSLAQECNIEPPTVETSRNLLVRAWNSTIQGVRELVYGLEPPGKGIRMGGPPVDNVAIDVEGERTLMRLFGLSVVVGVGISFLCFRSWRLTAMVFWAAILSAGIGLAIVFFTGSSVDAIMLSMPSLVYVLTISGAVHIVNYYHDAIREKGLESAPDRALGLGWFPCTMAAVTTAIGLGSLVRSDVIPIAKFGLYSALGVLATLGLLFLVLPALFNYFPSRKYAEKHAGKGDTKAADPLISRAWRKAGGFIVRHNVAVSAGCLAVLVFFFIGLPQIRTTVKLMKFFSADAEIIHHYRWLENHLGPLVPMEVVLKIDNEKCDLTFVDRMRFAQEVEHEIEKLDGVGGALSAATLAPDIQPIKGKPLFIARIVGLNTGQQQRIRDKKLNKLMEPHRKEFRDYLAVEGDPTLEELGIDGRLAARLSTQDLNSLKAIENYGDRKKSIQVNLASIDGIHYDEAGDIEKQIGQWQNQHGQELWRVTARVEALSDLDYAEFVGTLQEKVEPLLAAKRRELGFEEGEGVTAVYTGLVPLVYKTQNVLLWGLFKSVALAFVLIAFVMIFVLRRASAGLLSMIPNVFPVVVIFGIMGWMGILVDVGSMMCASVALGIAVDDTMHYLAWFRRGLDAGLDRKGAAMMAYERCATAMTQTTLIGGLGLSVFAFSTFTPTQEFGVMMLVLLFTALFGDLVFLPALLTGPLGRCFDRRKKKGKPEPPRLIETPDDENAGAKVAAPPMEPHTTTLHFRGDSSHRAPQTQ